MDEYLHKDDQGVMILDGHRQGGDRREGQDRRGPLPLVAPSRTERRQVSFRREHGERRTGPVYSIMDLFHENLSSFVIGAFLVILGLCMVLTGLTFLPVIGLYVGAVVLAAGIGFLAQAFRSRWPSL